MPRPCHYQVSGQAGRVGCISQMPQRDRVPGASLWAQALPQGTAQLSRLSSSRAPPGSPGRLRDHLRIGMGGKRAGEMYGSDRTAHPQGIWLSSSDSFELSQEFLCSMRIQPTLKCKHSKKAGIPFHKTLLMELSTVFMKNRNICIWQSMS